MFFMCVSVLAQIINELYSFTLVVFMSLNNHNQTHRIIMLIIIITACVCVFCKLRDFLFFSKTTGHIIVADLQQDMGFSTV